MKRNTMKYLTAGFIVVLAVGYLAYASMKDGWACYHLPVDEYMAKADQYRGQRLRLAGKVASDGLVAGAGKLGAEFGLVGESKRVQVVYKGIVPDMFKAGGEVVVEGKVDAAGVVRADVLMTKCASKYESKDHGKKGTKAS